MNKVIEIRKFKEEKKVGKVSEEKRKKFNMYGKLETKAVSTDTLIKEYLKCDKSLLKLAVYIIEQYGYLCCRNKEYIFEEIKRDMKYCEVQPEISKRYKAHLGVKVNGEWHFIEVKTNYSNAFDKKFNEIGNYNIKGFRLGLEQLSSTEMKSEIAMGELDNIVNLVHDFVLESMKYSITTFDCQKFVFLPSGMVEAKYKMLELDMPVYAIIEGTEVLSGQKHLVFLYRGESGREYAKYYRKKYADSGLPLYYSQMTTLNEIESRILKPSVCHCWKKRFNGCLRKRFTLDE